MQGFVDIEDWVRDQPNAQIPTAESYRVRLWDGDGFDEKRSLGDAEPTGRQVLEAFDRTPADEHVLLYLPHNQKLREIEIDETLDLRAQGPERFFAFKTDRLLKFMVNGRRFSWGAQTISVEMIRLVARIPSNEALFLERTDEGLLGGQVNLIEHPVQKDQRGPVRGHLGRDRDKVGTDIGPPEGQHRFPPAQHRRKPCPPPRAGPGFTEADTDQI